jgi:hypothetical protein
MRQAEETAGAVRNCRLMQSVLEKEKQKEIRRRHAANFCMRMRYESPGVGSADSARTSSRPFTPPEPSYASSSSNCIHH